MPRYVLPPDLPRDVRDFEAVMLPLSWGIIRALSDSGALTVGELQDRLGAALAGLLTRLECLETVGVILPAECRNRPRRYHLDIQRLDQIITTWRAYLGVQ